MATDCQHEFEVTFGWLKSISFRCKKCRGIARMNGKFAGRIYLLGLVGWLPFIWLELKVGMSLSTFLLGVTIYFLVNIAVGWATYRYLRVLPSKTLKKYMNDRDLYDLK